MAQATEAGLVEESKGDENEAVGGCEQVAKEVKSTDDDTKETGEGEESKKNLKKEILLTAFKRNEEEEKVPSEQDEFAWITEIDHFGNSYLVLSNLSSRTIKIGE